jgi:hypothetical protein
MNHNLFQQTKKLLIHGTPHLNRSDLDPNEFSPKYAAYLSGIKDSVKFCTSKPRTRIIKKYPKEKSIPNQDPSHVLHQLVGYSVLFDSNFMKTIFLFVYSGIYPLFILKIALNSLGTHLLVCWWCTPS